MTYFYDKSTKEYLESKKLDKAFGTSIPNTTQKEPLVPKVGFAVCFDESKDEWEYKVDNRDKTAYVTSDKSEIKITYIGAIKSEHTLKKPTQFDKWDEVKKGWVEDTQLKTDYEEAQAKIQKAKELNELTIDINTVFYDANQEAIGNMAAVVAIATAKFQKAISVGIVKEGDTEPTLMNNAQAYQYVYKDQKVTWKGADNKPHVVQVESLVEASEKAMTAKQVILFKY